MSMVFVSMGGTPGTSAGARTRTWAEVNVRPRPLVNRNHTLERYHYVSDPHQQVSYHCRRHQCVAIACFAETSVFLNIARPQLCSPHGTRLQCVCAVSRHTHASPRQEFWPPLLPPLLCECCVCTHLRMSVRVHPVLCLCYQFFVLCCLSVIFSDRLFFWCG